MFLRQFIQCILGLVFLVTSSLALSNTEFTYNVIDSGIELTGCDGMCPEELLLPAKINGIDVTNIADNAFNESGIKKIVIPNSTNISSKAFAFNSLVEVIFLDDLGVVSEDAFLISEHNKHPEIVLKNAQRLEHKLAIEQLYAELEYLRSILSPDACICLPEEPPFYDPSVYDPSVFDLIDLQHRQDEIEAEIIVLEVTLLAIEAEIYDLITSSYITLNDASIEYSRLKQNYDACASDDFSCKLIADIALYKYSHCDENDEICIAAAYRGDEILREDVFYYCSNSTGIAEKSIATSKSYFYELTQPYDYDGCYPSCPVCADCGGMPPFPEGNEIIERVYTHSLIPELNQNCDEIISDYPLEIFDNETDFTYNVIDGGIEVTGCSDIPTWPWHSCPNHMVIPEYIDGYSVISIGENAFSGKDLFSVSLPNSLISIQKWAFDFNNISNIVFPEGLIRIGEDAFANNELVTVNIPSSVVEIGGGAFKENIGENFENWNYIQLNDQILLLGCVSSCPSDLVIPQTINGLQVAYIGEEAFIEENINTITLPDGILEIYDEAFAENNLTEVFVPNTVTSLSTNAFKYSTGIQSGVFSYLKINNSALMLGCLDSCISSLIIPETIDGNSVKFVDDGAFEGLGITSLTLPTNLEHIEEWGFAYNLIENVTIPFNVMSLRGHSFEANPLEKVHFMGNRPEFEITEGDFQSSSTLSLVTYCPKTTGWPGEPIEGISPTLDVNCDSDNDGVINTEDDFPFDSSRHLDDIQYSVLDLDQNGSFDALTDGLILLRYAFGLTGSSLVDGAIASDATRTSASEIEAHIQSLLP